MSDGQSSSTVPRRGVSNREILSLSSSQAQIRCISGITSSTGNSLHQNNIIDPEPAPNSLLSSSRVAGATRTSIVLRNYSSNSVSTTVRGDNGKSTSSKSDVDANKRITLMSSPLRDSQLPAEPQLGSSPSFAVGVKPASHTNNSAAEVVEGENNSTFQNMGNGAMASMAEVVNPYNAETESSLYRNLDPSQLAVVTHDPSIPALVEAGPGSGKTQTIVHRLAYLLDKHKIRPHQILVVCFTRQAAEALRQRLHSVLASSLPRDTRIPDSGIADPIFSMNPAYLVKIKTLHAFGLECLRRFGVVGPETEVYDVLKQKKLARRLVEKYGLYNKGADAVEDLLQYISSVKRSTKWTEGLALMEKINGSGINANFPAPIRNEALEEAEGVGNGGSQPRDEPFYTHDKQTVHLFARYQHALREEHAIDFDDLQYMFYQMLKPVSASALSSSSGAFGSESEHTYPSLVAHRLRSEILHIFVDEFQDLNEIQFEILTQLAGESCPVTCVGDPHQCIYGWRGALPNIFSRWVKRFPKTVVLFLAMNYRSTPALVHLTNAFVKGRKQRSYMETLGPGEGELGAKQGRPAIVVECTSTSTSSISGLQSPGMVDTSGGGPSVDNIELSLATCQAVRYVVEEILRCKASSRHASAKGRQHGIPLVYGDIAILCRTRKTVKEMVNFLEQHRIPVQELKSGPLASAAIGSSNPLVFAQALIAYLRCCLLSPSNEDVELALRNGPSHRIADRQQKRFFFDLHATSVMMRQDDAPQPQNGHSNRTPVYSPFVSHYFRDSNTTANSTSINSPVFPCSFYSVIQQMVFHQFDPQRFPKVNATKPMQKVLNKFMQCTGYARDLLYRSALTSTYTRPRSALQSSSDESKTVVPLFVSLKEEALSSLHSSISAVKEVLQFVVVEAGFDGDQASNICVQHKKSVRRPPVLGEKRRRGALHNNQHDRGTFSANLVAEVASSLSTAGTSNEVKIGGNGNEGEIDEEDEEQFCVTRLLMETCARVEHTVQMELEKLAAIKVEKNEDDSEVQGCETWGMGKLPPDEVAVASNMVGGVLAPSPSLLLSRILDDFTDQIIAMEENCGSSNYNNDGSVNDCGEEFVKSSTAGEGRSHQHQRHSRFRPLGKITVGTAHSSKGLEWPAVIIPYCCDGAYPVSGHPEERRVFYVALTRAKQDLFLLTSALLQLTESTPDGTSPKEDIHTSSTSRVTHDRDGTQQLHVVRPCSPYLRELKGHYEILSWESLRRQQLETHIE